VRALVVDQVHLFHAELANFLFAEVLAFAAAWSSGTAAWTTFAARTAFASTFTPRAAMTAVPAFTLRSAFCAWRCGRSCCLFLLLFLCHLVHPFNFFRISFSIHANSMRAKLSLQPLAAPELELRELRPGAAGDVPRAFRASRRASSGASNL